MDIDLNNTFWDKLKGFVSEHRVDTRWILRENETERPLGSLRIVSHPDLPPGFLRAVFTYMTNIRKKTKEEKLQTVEDYQMKMEELEVYSIHDDIQTETQKFEAPYKELEEMFGVKVFE
jgi:hypothetical protein